MTKKAISLLRVSTSAQAGPDRHGLPAQRRTVQQIANHHSLKIVEEVSIQVSGARVLQDVNFRRVLELIRRPEIHGVVVADMDRLMRPEDPGYYSIFSQFKDSETVIYTSSGAKDFRQDRLLMIIESEVANMERQRIADRTRRGREEKRRLGKKAEGPVGIPRGVRFDYETETWAYVFPEAGRVQEAFRLFLGSDGTLSFAEIGRRVGLKAGNGSTAVRSLLRQPLYAGIYRVDRTWHKEVGPDGKERLRAVARHRDEIHEHAVIDPPLISKTEFDRVQELLALRKPRRPPRRNPDLQKPDYAGFLDCGECGAALWVQPETSRNRAAYLCGNSRKSGCPTGSTSHAVADPQLDEQLEKVLGSLESLTSIIEAATQDGDRRAGGAVRSYERRLREIDNEKTRAGDAYVRGAFGPDTLQKRVDALQDEARAIQSLVERESSDVPEVNAETLLELAEVFSSWTTLTRREKRALLRDFQVRAVVTRPKKRKLKVQSVRIGVALDRRLMFKKLKRHGMQ